MKTILALLSAACLCAHGATQAQSGTPFAPTATTPTPPASKLPATPARPGSGQTASLSESEGSNCPRDENGDPRCVVTSSGTRSGGGSYTPPEPGKQPGGAMSGDGAGGGAGGGAGTDPKEEERKKKKDDFDNECEKKREKMDAADNLILQSALKHCNDTYGGGWFGAPLGSLWNLAMFGLPMQQCLTDARNEYSSHLSANLDMQKICKYNNPYK